MNTELHIKEMLNDFKELFGVCPSTVNRLAGAGGDRVYYRLQASDADKEFGCLGVVGTSVVENRAFVELADVFAENGVNVPKVLRVGKSGFTYLVEDLGDESLFSILKTDRVDNLLESTVRELARLQTLDEDCWKDLVMEKPFSRRQAMWDLNYFKYEYVKPSGIEFNEDLLEDDFVEFADLLQNQRSDCYGFMYRDCQSRNVMIFGNQPYWIDFQAGRKGPCVYDIVSFLWQAKANFSMQKRSELLDVYTSEFAKYRGAEAAIALRDSVGVFALFRTLQVLGAYGFRGLIQKRAHFIESIPGAIANLRQLLDDGMVSNFPELEKLCGKICDDCRFKMETFDALTVELFSFSYKKGYPDDYSGNGGGFMFDCRGMHNPGRYDQYKMLTGRDTPVIEFLEERGEVQKFTERAFGIVEDVIKRYLQRGFKKLQIGFGCTGGQHRSVYCADALAKMIRSEFPMCRIVLTHREQGIKEVYMP